MSADRYEIASFDEQNLESVLDTWQKVVSHPYGSGIDETAFYERVLSNPDFDPNGMPIAKINGKTIGFALAIAPKNGLAGFLGLLVVDSSHRQKGIGTSLLENVERFLKSRGKAKVRAGYRLVSLIDGVDVAMSGYRFLLNRGFRSRGSLSLFMQMDLDAFEWSEEASGFVESNKANGIAFGLCDGSHRKSLCQFLEGLFPGGWVVSVKRAIEESPPYRVCVATRGSQVIGFAGPMRVHADGRGGFAGIGTHPDYRRRGIGTVLFQLMCAEFKKRGAKYSTLLTGLHNPAQEIYFGAGFRVHRVIDDTLAKHLS